MADKTEARSHARQVAGSVAAAILLVLLVVTLVTAKIGRGPTRRRSENVASCWRSDGSSGRRAAKNDRSGVKRETTGRDRPEER